MTMSYENGSEVARSGRERLPANLKDPSGLSALLFGLRSIAIHGNHCGPKSGRDPTIDCVDEACKFHDHCLATVWDWINPIKSHLCSCAFYSMINDCYQNRCHEYKPVWDPIWFYACYACTANQFMLCSGGPPKAR
jgi:hypothetical protein